MDSVEVVRYFREVLGDFHPEAITESGRFVLKVGSFGVPIFVERIEQATYPQIRLSSFLSNSEIYRTFTYTYTKGVAPNEDPNLNYKRSRIDSILHRTNIQVDIYGQNKIQVFQIRDALRDRIYRFFNIDIAFLTETEWIQQGNIYLSTNYSTKDPILKVEEGTTHLTKSDDASATGTWALTDAGLLVHPINDISQIRIAENENNGLAFSDGDCTREKGFMNLKVVRSRPMEDTNPLVQRWLYTFRIDYREDIEMGIGRSVNELDINE